MTLMPTFAASHIDQNKNPTTTSCLSSILFKPGTTMRDERLHGVNTKIHGNNDSEVSPYPLPERTVSSLSSWRRFCNLNTLSRCLSSFLCHFQRKGLHNTPGQEETCTAQLYKGCGWYDLTTGTWIPAYCIGVIYLVGKGWGAKKSVPYHGTLWTPALCQTNIINTVSIGHLPTSASAGTIQESRTWGMFIHFY